MIRFLIKWFSASKSAPSNGGDTELWQAGDIAECVIEGLWLPEEQSLFSFPGPELGQLARVKEVMLPSGRTGKGEVYLAFSAWPTQTFEASAFRKVRPQADEATAADAAFIDRLRDSSEPAPIAPPATKPQRELEDA